VKFNAPNFCCKSVRDVVTTFNLETPANGYIPRPVGLLSVLRTIFMREKQKSSVFILAERKSIHC